METQSLIDSEYLNDDLWWKKAVLNVARSGKFSSDRTVMEYARDIWHIGPYEKSGRPKSFLRNGATVAKPVAGQSAEAGPEPEIKQHVAD